MTRTASLVGVFLAGITATTYAARESITVTQDDITFKVSRFDDGRSKPYEVKFDQDDVSPKFKFNRDGFVTRLNIGTEKYRVLYKSNGDFKRVRRVDSGARMLQAEDIEDVDEDGMSGRRRLYDCPDCVDAWDMVCNEGVPSVCSIMGSGSPLTDMATASMETFCESFGSACSLSGGYETCEDQCGPECERSLAISLEWFSSGDLDLHVFEPSGVEVYFANRNGAVGFLDNDNTNGPGSDPENYLLFRDLSVDDDSVLGDYTAVVELYDIGGNSIPWKLTATSNGQELWVEEGEFVSSGDDSPIFKATVTEYIDNGCSNTALGTAAIEGDSVKGQTTP